MIYFCYSSILKKVRVCMHNNRRWSELNGEQNKPVTIKQKHPLTFRLRNHHQFKKIIFAVCSSLLIGLTFGFIILNMLKQEDPEQASILNTSTANQQEDQENGDTKQIDSVEFFVVQGGVFSEQENALKWAESFNDNGFPAVDWQRDGNYYLFTGVFQTEESAKLVANQMDKQGLDAYVKQWETLNGQLTLTEAENAFLQSFIEAWDESLQSLEKEGGLSNEKWEALINTDQAYSPEFNHFVDQISTEIEIEGKEDKERFILLKLIKEFEQLLAS